MYAQIEVVAEMGYQHKIEHYPSIQLTNFSIAYRYYQRIQSRSWRTWLSLFTLMRAKTFFLLTVVMDIEAEYKQFQQSNAPKAPRSKSKKRKNKKKNKNNQQNGGYQSNEQSTKKKKKKKQTKTKKKNQNGNNNNKQQNKSKRRKKKKKRKANKKQRAQYRIGVVMILPKNKKDHGWIYCPSTNTMDRLPYSEQRTLQKDQKVLFIAKGVEYIHIINVSYIDIINTQIKHRRILGKRCTTITTDCSRFCTKGIFE